MNLYIFFHLFFFVLLGFCESSERNLDVKSNCSKLHLEILVSPLATKKAVRRLEIQWEHAPKNKGDWIGIFRSDPLVPGNSSLPAVVETIFVTSPHGWKNTSIFEDHLEPHELGYYGKCLDYYAGYFDTHNNTLSVTCLRIEPNWMWKLKNEIGSKQLKNVFLPGSHDSAAYEEYNDNLRNSIVKKYSITQDESVLSQLIYGIRYLDLRVGYYPKNNEPWWANHGIVKIHPLKKIFKDVRTFLNNTNEIVILDIQEFPIGFKTIDIHYLLVDLLKKELENYYLPRLGWSSTLNEIWKTGKRLIIGYDRNEIVTKTNFLWPSVQQKWGNVQNLNSLYTYLSGLIERPPTNIWSAMAELTPTALDIILDKYKGLRVMAESVNHNVTEWFRREEWQPRSNIVTVDFFRNTGIIRSAIEWNKNQGKCLN